MKHYLTIILLLLSASSFSQARSYAQIGAAAYMSTTGSYGYMGGGLGAGTSKGMGGLGINLELIAREKQVVLPVYADMRFYFSKKVTSIYATLQPGYNFRNNPTTTEVNVTYKDKGGIFAAIGTGYYVPVKKGPGLNVQLKYVFMQDKLKAVYQNYSSIQSTHAGFISLCASVVF